MKKQMVKLIMFFKREHWTKYMVQIILFVAWLVVFFLWARADVVSNVVGTIVGFLFSTILIYFLKLFSMNFEDMLKVNYDTEALLKRYKGAPEYRKRLELNGTSVEFAYADTLVNNNHTVTVVDNPGKMFELDDFVMSNYERIFSAHSGSAKINGLTIRVDKVEKMDDLCTIYLSRSTYFNHLLTNRAIDFAIFDDVTIRDVLEYGPVLNSYEDSKMSNHVGINGLVFLSDGNLLVPRRKNDSTISKNKITSSIAVKLDFPKDGSKIVTMEHLLYQTIIDNLSARVKIRPEDLNLDHIKVEFLGFGQNIYEGGKPQFYYVVHLEDIDTERFHKLNTFNLEESKLDVDKCIYVADYKTYHFEKNKVVFDSIEKDGRRKEIKIGYEMSYLCNLWHYQQKNKEF